MKLAIVGSVSLAGDPRAAALIEKLLDQYTPSCVISGGAIGIDTMAVDAAKRRGIATSVHLPTRQAWPAFKVRNLRIAEECDQLVRIAAKNAKTYGSGWTRDRAKEMGKPTEEYIIS